MMLLMSTNVNERETVSSMVPAAVAEWDAAAFEDGCEIDLEVTQRISDTVLALVRDVCRHGKAGE